MRFHALENPRLGNLSAICSECKSRDIRRARLRIADVVQLLLLKYPIRCQACRARNHLGILQAFRLDRPPRRM
jgi:hypothetical protein